MAEAKKKAEAKSQLFLSIVKEPIKFVATSFLSFVAISLQKSPSISIIPPTSKAKRVLAVPRKEDVSGPVIGL